MANVYTDLPTEHPGERALAKQLEAMPDQKLHLWFNLSLPGAKELDLVIWHEEAGVFVVEVKAVGLNQVLEFSYDMCTIEYPTGLYEGFSPHKQASTARYTLLNFLGAQLKKKLWIEATACWPKFTRAAWNAQWDNDDVIGPFAEKMLFLDDCYRGTAALLNRLKYIRKNPPQGPGALRPFIHDPECFDEFRRRLDSKSRPKPAQSDLDKLRQLEHAVIEETERGVPIGSTEKIIFRGYPGTGKTFRLLAIGMHHARAGRKVLFGCFNKVLAADIKRLVSLWHPKDVDPERLCLQVYDVFELLSERNHHRGKDLVSDAPEESHDAWGEAVTNALELRVDEIPRYDLVLINESQDMKPYMLRVLTLHAAEDVSICVADGMGQELYSTPSEWMYGFERNADQKRLRHNFRNTQRVFQLAHVFYAAWPDIEKIGTVVRKFRQTRISEPFMPIFDRPGGELPFMAEIKDRPLDRHAPEHSIVDKQEDLLVSDYAAIIRAQMDALREKGSSCPMDLLLLVPSFECKERRLVLDALRKECIAFTDYTDEKERRSMARSDYIRLCTFKSSRGIEGYRVVVFGFERIEEISGQDAALVKNIGYAILSRAVFECVIVRRATTQNSKPMQFVSAALEELRRERT